MATIPKNVERGAAFLDERLPGWDERIDLKTLDLSNNCNCILGQLNPGEKRRRHLRYWAGAEALGVQEDVDRLGFITWGRQKYDNLTAGWRRLIEQRRAARG